MYADADLVRHAMTSGARSRRRLLPVLSLGLLCTLAACYSDGSNGERHGDANAGAAPGAAEIYPAGILTTRDAKGGIRGVYPGAASCCWLGPEARFRVDADADAKTLKLTVFEPELGNLTASQRVSLLDTAGRVFSSHVVKAGGQTFTLAIPKNVVANGSVSVRLRMAASVVPKDLGVNGDNRRLSLILQDVSAQ